MNEEKYKELLEENRLLKGKLKLFGQQLQTGVNPYLETTG